MTTAIRDLRNLKQPGIDPLPDDVRIDGRTCLVAGADSGLGRAAATGLARRGGNMILADRVMIDRRGRGLGEFGSDFGGGGDGGVDV